METSARTGTVLSTSTVVEQSPTEAIVTAVAEAEGVDPVDLTPPLYDVIDSDALNRLFEGRDSAYTFTFSYCGYMVELTDTSVYVTAE